MCDRCLSLSRRSLLAASLAFAATGASVKATGPDPGLAVRVTDDLVIYRREAWAGSSRPPVGPLTDEDVRFLLVHHTASANDSDPISVMRLAYDFHTGPEKGWPDVAYNFFIDQNGVAYEARQGSLANSVEASATGGSQGYAQLVCLLGDFTSVMPSAAALATLESVLVWLADRFGVDLAPGASASFESRGSNRWPQGTVVDTPTIAGHRDMSQTACPGDTFYPYLINTLRPSLARRAQRPAATTTSTSEPPATTASSTTTTQLTTTTGPATTVVSEPPATNGSMNTPSTTSLPPTALPPGGPPGSTTPASTGDADAGDARNLETGLAVAAIAGGAIATGAAIARRRKAPSDQ